MRCPQKCGDLVYETALSHGHVLDLAANAGLMLTATVATTRTLVFWLSGFGAAVVVHPPAQLRVELGAIAR